MGRSDAQLFGGVRLPGQPDLENVRKIDLLPMPAVWEMMRYGFAIDRDHLSDLSGRLKSEMKDLRGEICSYIPEDKLDEFSGKAQAMDEESEKGSEGVGSGLDDPMNVESTFQLARLLFDVLGVGEGKKLKRTKSGDKISTGKKQLEQLKREHPVIVKILEYRERAKLLGTYAEKLPRIAKKHVGIGCWCGIKHPVGDGGESWRVHTTLMTTRTSTSRLASKNPNLQNIPARSTLGREVRRGFVATGGTELVGCDYSQIEMRLGADYSRDKNLIRIFDLGLDPHTDTAMRAFGLSQEVVESKEGKLLYRAPCKNVNFGIFYGLSDVGLLDQMALTYATAGKELPGEINQEWCKRFIESWFELYPGVKGYVENQWYRARRYGIVWDLFGRVRRVPEVRSIHEDIQNAGLRQAGNMPIQATAAEVMKLGVARVQLEVVEEMRRQGFWCWPIMQVHDELILEVEEGMGEVVKIQMEQVMGSVMEDVRTGKNLCRVPVLAEGKVMKRWEK